ncbi:MAG: lipid A-modifier LpxR family protein [Alphaproteobacteria bacterium]
MRRRWGNGEPFGRLRPKLRERPFPKWPLFARPQTVSHHSRGRGGIPASTFPASAQQTNDDDSWPICNFIFENDLFATSDGHYKNGIQFSWLTGIQKDTSWRRDVAMAMPTFDSDTSRASNIRSASRSTHLAR